MNALSLDQVTQSGNARYDRSPEMSAPCATIVATARARAAWILKLRRDRERTLPGVQFGDASWDILLDLFVRQTDGRLTSVSSACIGSGSPTTTALRHVTALVNAGLLIRWNSGDDGRVGYVELTDDAYGRLAKSLAQGLL